LTYLLITARLCWRIFSALRPIPSQVFEAHKVGFWGELGSGARFFGSGASRKNGSGAIMICDETVKILIEILDLLRCIWYIIMSIRSACTEAHNLNLNQGPLGGSLLKREHSGKILRRTNLLPYPTWSYIKATTEKINISTYLNFMKIGSLIAWIDHIVERSGNRTRASRSRYTSVRSK